MPLSGWAAELAQQAQWLGIEENTVRLRMAIRSAEDSQAKEHLNTVLNAYFDCAVCLEIEYGNPNEDTAFSLAEAEKAKRQAQAEADAQQNPFILALMQQFDAQIMPDSIQVHSLTKD